MQATVVGSLAAFAAVVMGWILDGEFNIHHATLLCASSLVTATLASLILGSVMAAVVVCSRKCNINPDNVATPIAASLGDLITLALLSAISRFLHSCLGKFEIKRVSSFCHENCVRICNAFYKNNNTVITLTSSPRSRFSEVLELRAFVH